MDKGIYTLIVRLKEERRILVGSLGSIVLSVGYYAYTGSARGPGGLKRLERHKRFIQGMKQTKKWHIDYLLPSVDFLGAVITHTDKNLECMIATRIGAELSALPSFGCTDCSCYSHLHYSESLSRIWSIVLNSHKEYNELNHSESL